jgi:hypothetical protein
LPGTVAVAIAAARSTRKATSKTVDGATQDTIRALNAARDDRLWEKQAAAYEETLASLLYRLAKRHDVLNPYRMPEDAEQAKQAKLSLLTIHLTGSGRRLACSPTVPRT